ncbi:right-handed parallel beta-helix repeat-containing protein [Candidatus Gottesmanbacteria bacterium]|nr:right-handed parallel beta-helix repeat-containing protein [Candidatus Gottesmanbacteria bacterium]
MKITARLFILVIFISFIFARPSSVLSQIPQPDIIVCPENSNDSACQFFGPDGIQQAVDKSTYGTFILVKQGTYLMRDEVRIIEKVVKILGEGENKTIISGENLPERTASMFQIGGSTAVIGNMQITKGVTGIVIYSTYAIDSRAQLFGLNINNNRIGIAITQDEPEFVIIHNNLIHHNSVGIEVVFGKSVTIQNNTIDSNQNSIFAGEGSGIWVNKPFTGKAYIYQNIITNNSHTGGIYSQVPSSQIENSYNLFWNNTVDYQGISQGKNDVYEDPKFVSNTDYHLQSTSPAKNKATDGTELGAYGGWGACNLDPSLCPISITPITASPTATLQPIPIQFGGDANGDNRVNILDFEILRGQFNTNGSSLSADFNNDNTVNILDFNILRDNFGVSKLQI